MVVHFDSKVVLATGASGGLGTAVMDAFLGQGATVAGVARRWDSPARERFLPLEADLTRPEEARAAVEKALSVCGAIDVLVHVMGGFAGGSPVAETDDQTWRSMLDINLNAAFYTCRAVLPRMLERGRGRIIAVGSRSGESPAAKLAAYSVSKAALHALVRSIAAEVKDSGVTANAVLPSVIDTPANRQSNPGADYAKWVKPEAIAELILWLASDAAEGVNGALIPIYGRA